MSSVSSTNTGSGALNLAVTGLASGMDWSTVVSALANAERAPEIKWKQTQTNLNTQNTIFSTLKTNLTTLQTDIKALKDPALFESATAQVSDSSIATATADAGATLGSFTFNITQMATAARIDGGGNISQPISADGDLSQVTLGTAGFATAITAGSFTVNGQQVTIATTDSLQDVFDKIASATASGSQVTAGYDPQTDSITLSSADGSPIVLGSATDTSNFLRVAQLYNNGNGSITSASALGSVRLTAAMADSDLAIALTDGGQGQGQFTINGVSVSYDAGTDSIRDVLNRINNSGAGVKATFNAQTDRFVITDSSTGDVGISLQDVTGNFLAATGLSSGQLVRGKNLLYTLSQGTTVDPTAPQLVSQSNTIASDSSGVEGLTLTALAKGTVTAAVSTDASKITTAIQTFVNDYNAAQNYIHTQTLVTNNSDGSVTPGPLTGDPTAYAITSSLRSMLTAVVSVTGLPGSMNQLSDLGIKTNGQNNSVTLDTNALSAAISNNQINLKTLFTDSAKGWVKQANDFLDRTIGDSGSLVTHQTTLANGIKSINTQISALEKKIASDTAKWNSEFQAMELAQSQTNQQLTYLSMQLTKSSA
jgi:flagellar hook-associated protein 2